MNRIVPEQRFRLPDDRKPFAICIQCKNELFEDDPVYEYEQELRCEDCMNQFMQDMKADCLVSWGDE